MRFNSFLSNGFNTSTIVNPPDERRVNPTFVPCSLVQWIKSISDSTIQRQFFKEIANMVAPRLLIPPGSPIHLDLLELMDFLDHPDYPNLLDHPDYPNLLDLPDLPELPELQILWTFWISHRHACGFQNLVWTPV